MPGVRLVGEHGEIKTGRQTSLRLCQLPVLPERGQGQTLPKRWQTLTAKIQELLSGPTCPVQHLMSLIGLLTPTEMQVHLGRLQIRPIE